MNSAKVKITSQKSSLTKTQANSLELDYLEQETQNWNLAKKDSENYRKFKTLDLPYLIFIDALLKKPWLEIWRTRYD